MVVVGYYFSSKRSKSKSRSKKRSASKKSKRPYIGDTIICKKHKGPVKVINMKKDGGTLVLSCGCHDRRWNLSDHPNLLKKSKKSGLSQVASPTTLKKYKRPSTCDTIICNKHKGPVKVVDILLDGGTLVLSCGCLDSSWNNLRFF